VDSVLVFGRSSRFARDTATIRVALPPGREFVTVAVHYRGAPVDGLIIRTDSTGRHTFFGDNWPNRARHWLPTVDHPSDKALVSWTIIAPQRMNVVANGILVDSASEDGDRTWHFKSSRPLPTYLMVLGAAEMVQTPLGDTACGLTEIGRCVPQVVYTTPELRDYVPGPFARAGDIVSWIARLIGPFPYERLAHVQTSTRFGGMENATAIFYSDGAFRRRAVRVGLIAHETAHQWFGDAVTPREWGHLWLSEGFATYFEQLWHEHDLGSDSLRAGMARIRAQVVQSKVSAERPVLDTAQTDLMALLNTNSYQKGGFVLHMLRGIVGDSAFFRGTRAYYAQHRHGNALTRDLQSAMERASNMQLGWFFDQWLRRPGFPVVTTSWKFDPARGALVISVEQGAKHGLFRFPLSMDVFDGSAVRRITVEVPAERTSMIALPMSRAPSQVVFDPDVQLLGVIEESGRK
jgi:aminopeptidase N